MEEKIMEKELEKNCTCTDDCNCEEHNCDCGCEENKPIIIEMEDIDGKKVKVEVVGTFDDSGKSYAIVNDLDEPDNSYIFEVQSTDEGDMLVSIDDEKEFDRLCNVIEELTK
jgi:uncharacterized protein YrzB (UPF0473 family)